MGFYLNPGNGSFKEALNTDIYVDKTEMILYVNRVVSTKKKYMSVSRPRRFGKTMAADMLCAYYDRTACSKDLFESCKISQNHSNGNEDDLPWNIYLGQFDVIRLVMTNFLKSKLSMEDSLNKMQKLVMRELVREYPDIDYYDKDDLIQSMADIYSETGQRFVIIIDEWDAAFREYKDDLSGQKQYLDFLRDWLKDKEYIALAYMTGILPIKKYGQHSALNMFTEYSMTSPMQLAPYTGFTSEEVQELCREYGRDFHQLREWYDGYEVSDIIPPDPDHEIMMSTGKGPEAKKYALYSPLSVVNAILNGRIQNYWNKTETYEALAEYIRKDFDGLKEAVAVLMNGGRIRIDVSGYQNDMTTFHNRDDVLSLLIHLGYLGYDDENSEVFVPNREILDEFRTSTRSDEWQPTFKSFELSQELLRFTWDQNEDKVAEILEDFHDRTENKTYNSEAALSYAVQYAYYAAQKYYTTIQELDTGKGYADIVFLPSPKYPHKPAMLIELKYQKDAKTALAQIQARNYPQKLEHYRGNLLLVSINYEKDIKNTDPEYKRHSCIIEKA